MYDSASIEDTYLPSVVLLYYSWTVDCSRLHCRLSLDFLPLQVNKYKKDHLVFLTCLFFNLISSSMRTSIYFISQKSPGPQYTHIPSPAAKLRVINYTMHAAPTLTTSNTMPRKVNILHTILYWKYLPWISTAASRFFFAILMVVVLC